MFAKRPDETVATFFPPGATCPLEKCWQVLTPPSRAQRCSNVLRVFPSFSCSWNVYYCCAFHINIWHKIGSLDCSTWISVQTPAWNCFNCFAKVGFIFWSSNGILFRLFWINWIDLNIQDHDLQLFVVCCYWYHMTMVQSHCRPR